MENELLWEGEGKDLTSLATGGRVVKKRYRITREFIFVDEGIIGSKEEQIPLWAVRDCDVKQSMLQKTRNVGDVHVRVETNDYTGKKSVTIENIETPKAVRDLLNEHSRLARDLRLRQQQTVNYSGVNPNLGFTPAAAAQSAAQVPQVAEDPIDKLTKLGTLLEKGLLTQEEFDAQKAKLLGL